MKTRGSPISANKNKKLKSTDAHVLDTLAKQDLADTRPTFEGESEVIGWVTATFLCLYDYQCRVITDRSIRHVVVWLKREL